LSLALTFQYQTVSSSGGQIQEFSVIQPDSISPTVKSSVWATWTK